MSGATSQSAAPADRVGLTRPRYLPPLVIFPSSRLRWLLGLLLGWLVGVGCVFGAWWHISSPPTWQRLASLGALVLLVVASFWQWLTLARGRLMWNGTTWLWAAAGVADAPQPFKPVLSLEVGVNGLGVVLVRLRIAPGDDGQGQTIWVLLSRSSDPVAWPQLQRALAYSVTHPQSQLGGARAG